MKKLLRKKSKKHMKDLDIKLIPYGFLAYRIAMFPLVGE